MALYMFMIQFKQQGQYPICHPRDFQVEAFHRAPLALSHVIWPLLLNIARIIEFLYLACLK